MNSVFFVASNGTVAVEILFNTSPIEYWATQGKGNNVKVITNNTFENKYCNFIFLN
jgi:adenosylmethionine-8-amino-7-oxononanoate aminotransferase